MAYIYNVEPNTNGKIVLHTTHGDVDIDRLYNKARPRLDGRKLPIKIPFIGKLTFAADDLDSLYKYIQEA